MAGCRTVPYERHRGCVKYAGPPPRCRPKGDNRMWYFRWSLARRDQVFESDSTDLAVDDWLTSDLLDELAAGLSADRDRD